MAHTGKALRLALPFLATFPDEQHFDVYGYGGVPRLACQAHSQEHMVRLRQHFPGALWAKSYNKSCKWWEYTTTLANGLEVKIFAVSEAPPTCKAIYGPRTRVEQVPTAWREEEVTEEVIVGWDCGGNGDDVPEAPEKEND